MHVREDGTECPCSSPRYCAADILEAFEEDSARKGHDRMHGYYRAAMSYEGPGGPIDGSRR